MNSFQKLFRISLRGKLQQFCRYNTSSNHINSFVQPQLVNPLISGLKNPWIWQENTNITIPNPVISYDLPIKIGQLSIIDPEPALDNSIEAPGTTESEIEKQAVKLIVIRRHKMRKHKLKKLRKKMKFEWAKRRQRREMKKEKEFQAGLLAQIKEAEMFSAEQYVAEKIKKATETPIPRFWKGKRLPEFIIREKLGLPPK